VQLWTDQSHPAIPGRLCPSASSSRLLCRSPPAHRQNGAATGKQLLVKIAPPRNQPLISLHPLDPQALPTYPPPPMHLLAKACTPARHQPYGQPASHCCAVFYNPPPVPLQQLPTPTQAGLTMPAPANTQGNATTFIPESLLPPVDPWPIPHGSPPAPMCGRNTMSTILSPSIARRCFQRLINTKGRVVQYRAAAAAGCGLAHLLPHRECHTSLPAGPPALAPGTSVLLAVALLTSTLCTVALVALALLAATPLAPHCS
jgi:hypothetical protein